MAKRVAPAKTPKTPAPVTQEVRLDGWENAFSGLGTARDRMMSGRFMLDPKLDDEQLASMYYGDDLVATVVEAHVNEAFRKGYCLKSNTDQEKPEALYKQAQEVHDLDSKIAEAAIWARLFGGSLLVFGMEDGGTLDMPLNDKAVKSCTYILVVDRRQVIIEKTYKAVGPKLGQPELYSITISQGKENQVLKVHESRTVRFNGVKVDRRKRNELAGWDQSVLQRPYQTLRAFGTSFQAVSLLLTEASVGVYKLKGLHAAISNKKHDQLETRMQLLDMSKSVARAVMVDADSESYERTAVSFSGIPDVLDRHMNRLSAASDGIPVSLLMGRSAAGMNATGDLDLDSWHGKVGSFQTKDLEPRVARCHWLLSLAKDSPMKGKPLTDMTVTWHPLRVQSAKEQAETYKAVAEADNLYLTNSVVPPEAIAIARFARGEFSTTDVPKVDVKALEAQQKLTATYDVEGLENEDTTAPAAAGPKVALTPSDTTAIITVNEARQSLGFPPLPGPDGNLMFAVFKVKNAETLVGAAKVEAGVDPNKEPEAPAKAPIAPAPGAPPPPTDKPVTEGGFRKPGDDAPADPGKASGEAKQPDDDTKEPEDDGSQEA